MSETLNITIVGFSSAKLNDIENALQSDMTIDVTRKLMLEGAVDPLEDISTTAGIVVIDLPDQWQDVMNAVNSRSVKSRPLIVFVGEQGHTEMMRMALKTGARDFQTHPLNPQELSESLHSISREKHSFEEGSNGEITVFIGAKGGSGVTSIVCSTALLLKEREPDKNVLILDLDFQYGNVPLHFDERANNKLALSLAANERIDPTLLDACIITTEHSVDILATYADQILLPWEINGQLISNMFNVILGRYDYVVIDCPRHIDVITFPAIERAKNICVVMQQEIADLRFARQMISLIRDQGIQNEKIKLLVNRHDNKNVVRVIDISDVLEGNSVMSVPNDYKRMSYCVDNGISLSKKWKSAAITKSIRTVVNKLWPLEETKKRRKFGLGRSTRSV